MNKADLESNPSGPAGPGIRVVIADDSRAARESLTVLLETYPGLTVAGTAENGREAIFQVNALKPDLAVLDLNMPVLSGMETARTLRSLYPALRILVVSVHDTPVSAENSLAAGADGFLAKPLLPVRLDPVMQRLFGCPTMEHSS